MWTSHYCENYAWKNYTFFPSSRWSGRRIRKYIWWMKDGNTCICPSATSNKIFVVIQIFFTVKMFLIWAEYCHWSAGGWSVYLPWCTTCHLSSETWYNFWLNIQCHHNFSANGTKIKQNIKIIQIQEGRTPCQARVLIICLTYGNVIDFSRI